MPGLHIRAGVSPRHSPTFASGFRYRRERRGEWRVNQIHISLAARANV